MIHIIPLDDDILHLDTVHCPCAPKVSQFDAAGYLILNGPLITHIALDGREQADSMSVIQNGIELKQWIVVKD